MKEYTWLVTKEPNAVANDAEAMKVQVKTTTAPAMTPEKAAKEAAQNAAGIHQQTMLAGFDQMIDIIFHALANGIPYHGKYLIIIPKVNGPILPQQPLDEAKLKLGFKLRYTEKLKKLLNNVKLQLIGNKNFLDFAKINSVKDENTNRFDGFVTKGDTICIQGTNIKVVGEPQTDDSLEPGIGVFLVPNNDPNKHINTRLDTNLPSKLYVKLPNTLQNNTDYTLKIITRFAGSAKLLVNKRTIIAKTKLRTYENKKK